VSYHIDPQDAAPSEPGVVLNIQERLTYKRVVDELGRTTAALRRRRGLTLKELSRKSAVPIRRLQQFEEARAAPHFVEMILLAPQYRIRLSEIAAQLRGVISSPLEQTTLARIPFSKALYCTEAAVLIEDTSEEQQRLMSEKLRSSEGYFATFVDITITEWPAMLPPNIGVSLLAEYRELAREKQVMTACFGTRGAPLGIQLTLPPQPGARKPPPGAMPYITCGALLDRVRMNAGHSTARLDLYLRRQAQLSGTEQMAHVVRRVGIAQAYLRQVVAQVNVIRPSGEAELDDGLGWVRRIEDIKHVPDMQNHPELKRVLKGVTLNLRKAMTLLENIMQHDC
jgi:transcriptional regulator with XRE-family HTH domain